MGILIDDAGVGLPVGGVLIGALRLPDPGQEPEFIYEEVPPSYFQGKAWEDKTCLRAVANAALRLLDGLHAPADESITVCHGWILSHARSRLGAVFSDVRS